MCWRNGSRNLRPTAPRRFLLGSVNGVLTPQLGDDKYARLSAVSNRRPRLPQCPSERARWGYFRGYVTTLVSAQLSAPRAKWTIGCGSLLSNQRYAIVWLAL